MPFRIHYLVITCCVFSFFPFRQCFRYAPVHVKDLESSSLPQKTLLLERLVISPTFNFGAHLHNVCKVASCSVLISSVESGMCEPTNQRVLDIQEGGALKSQEQKQSVSDCQSIGQY